MYVAVFEGEDLETLQCSPHSLLAYPCPGFYRGKSGPGGGVVMVQGASRAFKASALLLLRFDIC
jgi:hypothetical protein